MTFGEFVQILFNNYKGGITIPEFIRELIRNSIIDPSKSPVENDGELLYKYLKRGLPKNKAKFIHHNFNREQFETYIVEKFSDTAQDHIIRALKEKDMVNRPRGTHYASVCANIFEEIIKECAEGNRHYN